MSIPELMLSQPLHINDIVDVTHYYVSEKLDGVRAYWTGTQLLNRTNKAINAPKWFTEQLPKSPLDGELWLGRGQAYQVKNTVFKQQPDDRLWQQIRYYLFDLPKEQVPFGKRWILMQHLLQQGNLAGFIRLIPQMQINTRASLDDYLDRLIAQGGEGVMLHHKLAFYQGERSDYLLKYKRYEDKEAKVIGFSEGQGKYRGQTGALIIKNKKGDIFKVASGLTDQLRRLPPKIGTTILYRYDGLTKANKPRFVRFLKVID